MYRHSTTEWSGSAPVAAKGSLRAVAASSNETRCFLRFELAFCLSHSSVMLALYHDADLGACRVKPGTPARFVVTCTQDPGPSGQCPQRIGQDGFHHPSLHDPIVPVMAGSSSRLPAIALHCARAEQDAPPPSSSLRLPSLRAACRLCAASCGFTIARLPGRGQARPSTSAAGCLAAFLGCRTVRNRNGFRRDLLRRGGLTRMQV